jgi:predicted nucleotidyltransferase component of viral defense system
MKNNFLNKHQIDFLNLLSKKDFMCDFYLAGGTALSYFYLKHRISDDLDFFCNDEFDIMMIDSFLSDIKDKL